MKQPRNASGAAEHILQKKKYAHPTVIIPRTPLGLNRPSVFATIPIQYSAELVDDGIMHTFWALKADVCQNAVEEMFFEQLEEFCRMVQNEFLARFNEVTEVANSSSRALSYSETLMLCPTTEAARASIRRDLASSLSFVLAIQGMQRQLQLGTIKLPCEAPDFQTRFYLLALTVRGYLESLHPVSV